MKVATRTLSVLLLPALVGACSGGTVAPDPGEPVTDPARVSVVASVNHDSVTVAADQPSSGPDGTIEHAVEVTWSGEAPVTVDDARFTHHVRGNGRGDLVVAGRGCGAQWDEQRQAVVHPCTMDLQIIELAPGESHAYPVMIYPQVGPLGLAAGSYVVEQEVGWQGEREEGRFTITLTYTVK